MPWKGKMLAHFWRMLSLRELSRDSHGDCEFYQLVWEVLLGNQWTMREMIVTEPFQQTSLIFSQAHTLIEMPGFGWILCHPCGHTNEKNLTQGDKWGPQWEWERISLIYSHPRWKKCEGDHFSESRRQKVSFAWLGLQLGLKETTQISYCTLIQYTMHSAGVYTWTAESTHNCYSRWMGLSRSSY